MILFLRALFLVVLASMLWVTSRASWQCPLFAVPRDIFAHPWFIATMFDAYWGFMTFFVWVCYKQTSWLARLAWFVAILLLGNIAMSAYCLDELFRTPRDGRIADLLVVRRNGPGGLGLVLAGTGIVVVAFALTRR
jgi:predicted permease